MGQTTLGLDIGSNSVGWALVDEANGLLFGMGVRVFPEGVDRDTSGAEHSKNEQRRIARGHRRQIARRARRKAALRRSLIEAGFWSDEAGDVDADPYALRAKGLDESLTLAEFGRALMHLNQRRGFLSNRKADRGRRKENSETLQEISALAEAIQSSGARTLGEYFHQQRQSGNGSDIDKVRGKHTRRNMFEDEFERLWESQRRFYPDLLTEELKYGRQGKQTYPCEPRPLKRKGGNTLLQEYGFHGIMFFQRSLYWPKSVVGRCELTGEKRCERADRAAQRFRMLNEVNNLRVIPQKGEPRDLTPEERKNLIKLLSRKKEATFDEIRKKLGLLAGDGFNLEAGSRKKLHGAPIDHALSSRKKFGDFGKGWHDRSEEEKNSIVRTLLNAEEPEIIALATSQWGCTEEIAHELADLDLTAIVRGYSSYGLTAIEKLLPHLEVGLPMMSRDGQPSALSEAGFLRPDQRLAKQGDLLPLPSERITNPLVRQALFEVRKIVHAIIREYGKPNAIHIELAREVQGNAEKRSEASRKMRERERLRSAAADDIRAQGYKPSREGIDRWLLWREQGEICLYSGRPISPQQLLSGEADIDHILPYSRSLDNSLMNKVVAFRDENLRKGNRTPWEWVGETQPEQFDAILQRARALPYEIRNRKLLKLQQKEVSLEKFVARQLTDTGYITTQVLDLLRHLQGVDLVPVKGQLTAELRHMWGLNSVLRDDGLNLKNRDDHRHHAVDALVIALTNRSRLQHLARVRFTDEQLPLPWTNFRNVVEEAVDGIKVSHRSVRDLSGALHEDTIYGPTSKPHRHKGDKARPHAQGWIEEDGLFVLRKKLEDLTPAMVENIRDSQVKDVVIERLRQFGIEPRSKGKIPKDAWNEPLLLRRKGHRKSSRPSVIKKVRLVRRDGSIKPIRGGLAWVKPGNTHHIAIFELPAAKNKKPKRDMIAVSMMEASQRARRKEPLVCRRHPTNPEAKFLFSLSSGETVWANVRGREDLYVFKTAASTQGQIYFRSHLDARPSATAEKFVVKANTLDGVKVLVDPLGRIRNAND